MSMPSNTPPASTSDTLPWEMLTFWPERGEHPAALAFTNLPSSATQPTISDALTKCLTSHADLYTPKFGLEGPPASFQEGFQQALDEMTRKITNIVNDEPDKSLTISVSTWYRPQTDNLQLKYVISSEGDHDAEDLDAGNDPAEQDQEHSEQVRAIVRYHARSQAGKGAASSN